MSAAGQTLPPDTQMLAAGQTLLPGTLISAAGLALPPDTPILTAEHTQPSSTPMLTASQFSPLDTPMLAVEQTLPPSTPISAADQTLSSICMMAATDQTPDTPISVADLTLPPGNPMSAANQTLSSSSTMSAADQTLPSSNPISAADSTLPPGTPTSGAGQLLSPPIPISAADQTLSPGTPVSSADQILPAGILVPAAGQALPANKPRVRAGSAPPLAVALPSPPRPPGKHTVHWFRKGLRLHDNPSLREGLQDATTFRCVFVIDPWFASSTNVGINKWRFLLQCLEDLDGRLKKMNSRLFVIRGQPADVLPKLFREWGTSALTFEEDPEPYGRVRDHNIMSQCREVGITVTSHVSHTLYKLDKIIERNGGKAPLTYHQFQALIASMPPPPSPEADITDQDVNGATTPITDDHNERFGVPTLEELGFDTEGLKPPVWIGGETEALARLERHLERKAWVASFGRPKMTPQSLLASQTGLSPYLRFGCLSTRLFYYQLTELYKRVKRVQPPLSLHGQILWREFFYCAATRNPNFDHMEGNPICVQIPWERNQEALAKWASGQTGFPWIDAIMTQLREEGWIHHLARHAVACFLTRGDLWISWEEGMKVFDELLLDADWSVNAGMWMWLSCSSFFQQFFHCYCPVRFGRKTDPNGDFIRRYIPVLKNMPTRFIHEPWVAPEAVQVSARCVIGTDYPLPMVDHSKVSATNIERIKQVYAQLAKYKPQATLNPQAVQRPNVMHMSPSPTSIIASINQSNYLCTRAPEPNTERHIEVTVKNNQRIEVLKVHKQDTYDLKNVIIIQSDISQEYLSTNEICTQYTTTLNKNLIYDQKDIQVNCYSDGKQKYYLPTLTDNGLCIPNTFDHTENTLNYRLPVEQNGSNEQVANVKTEESFIVIEERKQIIHTDKCEYNSEPNGDRPAE